ncbi:O-acetyl-ADP-ribose deacetylase [Thalassiella azotivora]
MTGAPAQPARVVVEAVEGDITVQAVDAVVNAANSSLMGGGGVDGAIHAAAGPALLEECERLRRTAWPQGLPTGQAAVTGAGRMAARWVVHTVGPDARRGQTDPALLASCFSTSLLVAAGAGARSVAFPAVSAGVYGWDVREVADVAVRTVHEVLHGRPEDVAAVELVRFVLFGRRAHEAFLDALDRHRS